jgi:hypothetical protein
LFKRAWAVRFTQLFLVLGAIEWVITLIHLVAERRVCGQPWIRLGIILGFVILFTGGSAFIFSLSSALRSRYGMSNGLTEKNNFQRPNCGGSR